MTLRVGVVGAGLVAQAEHLPYLASLCDRFTIADPNDGGMLDVVGFDAAAPALIADFTRSA